MRTAVLILLTLSLWACASTDNAVIYCEYEQRCAGTTDEEVDECIMRLNDRMDDGRLSPSEIDPCVECVQDVACSDRSRCDDVCSDV